MHIHDAYTKLIAWLETPEGKSALACTLLLARSGMDKDQAKDKTEQILRDLKTDRLYQRDLRLVAAWCSSPASESSRSRTPPPARAATPRPALPSPSRPASG